MGVRKEGEEEVEVAGCSGSGWRVDRAGGGGDGGRGGGGGGSGGSDGVDAEFEEVFTCFSYMEKSAEMSFPHVLVFERHSKKSAARIKVSRLISLDSDVTVLKLKVTISRTNRGKK